MAKQEDLGYKLSKKIQFPQNDFNYLYENFDKFLVVSATDGNKLYSKPAAVNEGNDEGQDRHDFKPFLSTRGSGGSL